MAGIWNINSAYNLDSKPVQKKISFLLGEQFSARIINLDKLTNEAILKLLDGWQFSAQLKQPVDFTAEGLLKFQVEGYENGKLIIKIVSNSEENAKDNVLADTLEEQGLNIKKEDYNILQKMLKHNMSLSKENISTIKSLLDFQNKIVNNSFEEDNFILKYIENKNISLDSEKGQKIFNQLKGFFDQFKKLNLDELLTFMENDIQLTEENIKSFNKINNEPMHVYKEINKLGEQIYKDNIENLNFKEIQNNANEGKSIKNGEASNTNVVNNESKEINTLPKNNAYLQEAYGNKDLKEIDKKEFLKKLLDIDSPKDIEKDIDNISKNKPGINQGDLEEGSDPKAIKLEKEVEIVKIISENLKTSDKIKEQISDKANEMKEIIKQVLQENNSGKSEAFSKILQGLQEKMNDFKVFNSLSNQYYYLDVPLNVNEKEYPCKLIVKDDRKKGKKIDSTNVKFVATVDTTNMGTVDAYIKVSNNNINVDIKCEKKWVKVLDLAKEKLEKKLKELGYSTFIKVDKKEEEANLVHCRDFFQDMDFTRINLKV